MNKFTFKSICIILANFVRRNQREKSTHFPHDKRVYIRELFHGLRGFTFSQSTI
jgi:hypothetical protein